MKQISRRTFLSSSLALSGVTEAVQKLPSTSKNVKVENDNDATGAEPPPAANWALKYFKAKSLIQADYRSDFAEILKEATIIELLQLDPVMTDFSSLSDFDFKEFFPISPYNKLVKIIKTVRLDKGGMHDATAHFSRLLRTRNDMGGGAWCHKPRHAVRFRTEVGFIFRTSLCWTCANYYFQYPDDNETASWVGMEDKVLETFIRKHLPIPEEKKDETQEQKTEK